MLHWYRYFRELCENDSWNELRGQTSEISEREEGVFKDDVPKGMLHLCILMKDLSPSILLDLRVLQHCSGHRPSQSILALYKCDNVYDCIDRSDESNCNKTKQVRRLDNIQLNFGGAFI